MSGLDLVRDPITKAEKEFRKASDAVAVRVRSGPTLSLIGRRLFNVLVYHTQRLRSPGADAPAPFDTCPNPEDFYWLSLGDIAHDAAWGCKDFALVIEVLQQLQSTLVESDSKTRFSSVQLLGSVHVIKGSGRRPTLIGWEFPRSTRDILLNPDIYTKLSIGHLASLSTAGGTALYEIGKRYLTNHGGKTARRHWNWWHDALTGKQIGSVVYPQYRYFKRDILKTAITEVNRTDIQVELVEFKSGRLVGDLQFNIQPAQQPSLVLSSQLIVDSTLVDRLMVFGFSDRQSYEILCAHPIEYLRATLDLVESRVADTRLEPVKSPMAFIRKALKEDYCAGVKVPVIRPEPKIPSLRAKQAPADSVHSTNIAAALLRFDAAPREESDQWVENFFNSSPTHRRLKSHGVAFRQIFGNWLLTSGF